MSKSHPETPAVGRLIGRRRLLQGASAGTIITALGGGLYVLLGDELTRRARAESRPDGRARVPPGQRVIAQLKPMGGAEGDPAASRWTLRIHGEVASPYQLDFHQLLELPQLTRALDVHCVTGWSVLGAEWTGVRLVDLAARAKPLETAQHVIFEAAHGYTANVPLARALQEQNLIAHRLDGQRLARANGAPVRAVVPDLYFWKSAKWLTGIRFVRRDEPGYWESRGYHNRADPWLEQRYG